MLMQINNVSNHLYIPCVSGKISDPEFQYAPKFDTRMAHEYINCKSIYPYRKTRIKTLHKITNFIYKKKLVNY